MGEQTVSGGSEVWINASDWRRVAAVGREQNVRCGEEEKEEGIERTQKFGRKPIICLEMIQRRDGWT